MKNLFIIFGFVFVTVTLAQEKAPAPFDDSSIKRRLKNGKLQKFDGNKYKIVKRRKTKSKTKKQVKTKKNAVKLFLGYGPDDLDKEGNRVELDRNPFLGIGYQRMLNKEFSVEAIGTTNESLMIGGGYHF